jgi:hypothetical protein
MHTFLTNVLIHIRSLVLMAINVKIKKITGLMGCNAVKSEGKVPMFWRNILPPSSVQKRSLHMKTTYSLVRKGNRAQFRPVGNCAPSNLPLKFPP